MPTRPNLKTLAEAPWALLPTTLAQIVDWARRADLTAPSELALEGKHEGAMRVGGVAVIPVYGVVEYRSSWLMEYFGGCSVEGLRESLADALADPAVTAIVLDVDSPGGSVSGITELAAEIRAARGGAKPIVTSVNTLCASAAAWFGLQADEVVITPSGHVGSIGVYAVHQDISRMLDEMGVTMTLISAGEHKTEGNEYEPLSDDARADIQQRVNTTYGQFVADAAEGRRVTAASVEADFGGGRLLSARQAIAVGMVDRIESIGQTVQRLSRPAARRRAIAAEVLGPDVNAEDGGRLVPIDALPDLVAAHPDPEIRALGEAHKDDPSALDAALQAYLDEGDGQPPFTERVAAMASEAAFLAEHGRERARLRAKEGRPAFSMTTERSLRSIRAAVDEMLTPGDPASSAAPAVPVEPAPAGSVKPPAAAPIAPRFKSRADFLRHLEATAHR